MLSVLGGSPWGECVTTECVFPFTYDGKEYNNECAEVGGKTDPNGWCYTDKEQKNWAACGAPCKEGSISSLLQCWPKVSHILCYDLPVIPCGRGTNFEQGGV